MNETPYVTFKRGLDEYKVLRNPAPATPEETYLGYKNDHKVISAEKADVVVRRLLVKTKTPYDARLRIARHVVRQFKDYDLGQRPPD